MRPLLAFWMVFIYRSGAGYQWGATGAGARSDQTGVPQAQQLNVCLFMNRIQPKGMKECAEGQV